MFMTLTLKLQLMEWLDLLFLFLSIQYMCIIVVFNTWNCQNKRRHSQYAMIRMTCKQNVVFNNHHAG